MSIFIACVALANSLASDYYVSATASRTGDGTKNNPWQLQQALNSPAAISNAMDTVWIWLRGGFYTNNFDSQTSFSCYTKGKATAPIIFRNYPNERVIIDGQFTYTLACILGNCSYTWFWGIEVVNSDISDRDHSNINRLGNVYCTAPNIKFINMIIHDMGSGLDLWKTASNSESYGCIIYNIGNNLRNVNNWEGHGHGMYLQNDTIGLKNIHNNIVFNTYGNGIKIWQTTTTDAIGNFDVRKNIIFNGGAASENLGGVGNNSRTHNFFVVSNSVNNPIRNSVIKHNYTFSGINTPRPPVNAFGLNYGVDNFTLDSNYLTCQTRLGFNNTPVFNASVQGNKIIAGIPAEYGYYLWGFVNQDFPNNSYQPNQPILGLEYFVLANKYEPSRSHLVIYNWDNSATVQVDVSSAGLKKGDIIELINVMDYYNDIIIDTLTNNSILKIPMTGHTFAPVIGSSKPVVHQFPTFGTFVIRKIASLITTGINNYSIKKSLSVYPNPSNNICNVSAHIVNPGYYRMTVTDMLGNSKVYDQIIYLNEGDQLVSIDTKDYKNSLHFLTIEGHGLECKTKFIVHN